MRAVKAHCICSASENILWKVGHFQGFREQYLWCDFFSRRNSVLAGVYSMEIPLVYDSSKSGSIFYSYTLVQTKIKVFGTKPCFFDLQTSIQYFKCNLSIQIQHRQNTSGQLNKNRRVRGNKKIGMRTCNKLIKIISEKGSQGYDIKKDSIDQWDVRRICDCD